MKGRARSAQGQYFSLTGEPGFAEIGFEEALVEFSKPGLEEALAEQEKLQTSIYGAINALNHQRDNWKIWSTKVLSLSPDEIRQIGQNNLREEQYRHHLLLRIFWYRQEEEVQRLKEQYLTIRQHWKNNQHHPWELICLYRGIFLAQKGYDGSSQWFQRALNICGADAHGSILQLIGAMIATVAFCAEGKETFRTQAEDLLAKVSPKLPNAVSAITTLKSILESPSETAIGQALSVLPFNYH